MAPTSCIVAFVLTSASAVPGQTTWYVDDDQCPNPGSGTQADPFCSIQEGIAAALDGDSVVVLPGTYSEAIDFLGKAIIVKSRDGAATTVIAGDGVNAVVTFNHGEARDSVLGGFTITGAGFSSVGAIDCHASPTIRANVIRDNNTDFGAGGILSDGAALILNNLILNNGSTFSAGGLSLSGSTVAENNLIEGNGSGFHVGGASCFGHAVLRRNTILGNSTANGLVGGVLCGENARLEGNRILHNSFTVDALVGGVMCSEDCVLVGNEVAANLGGIYCSGSPTLVNNLIAGNTSLGGIVSAGVSVTVVNNTFHGNSTSFGAGAITCESGTVTVSNCIFWRDQGGSAAEITAIAAGASVVISWSDVEGGLGSVLASGGGSIQWGPGMIDADPLFADADGLDDDPSTPGDNDFHLAAVSPCVDAGDNAATGLPADDFEQDPRPVDVPGTPDLGNGTPPLADMGFDELHSHLYFKGDATPGGLLSLNVAALPGSTPVIAWFSMRVLNPPLTSRLGQWYLAPPLVPFFLPSIPFSGILSVSGTLPADPSAPYVLHFQALVGSGPVLTNLATLEVH